MTVSSSRPAIAEALTVCVVKLPPSRWVGGGCQFGGARGQTIRVRCSGYRTYRVLAGLAPLNPNRKAKFDSLDQENRRLPVACLCKRRRDWPVNSGYQTADPLTCESAMRVRDWPRKWSTNRIRSAAAQGESDPIESGAPERTGSRCSLYSTPRGVFACPELLSRVTLGGRGGQRLTLSVPRRGMFRCAAT